MYKLEKIQKKVEAFLSDGSSFTGSFYLEKKSSTHSGCQSLSDLFTNEISFFPFRLEDGEIILLHKDSIVMIAFKEKEFDPEVSVRKEIPVELCFISGDTLEGKVYSDLPTSHARLSDFLNHTRGFFYIEGKDKNYLVNSRFIKMARSDHGKRAGCIVHRVQENEKNRETKVIPK